MQTNRPIKLLKNPNGFSLIEILLALGGAVAVGLLITSITIRLQKNQVQSRISADVINLTNKIQSNLSNTKILKATAGTKGKASEPTGGNKVLNDCLYNGCANIYYTGPAQAIALYHNEDIAPATYDPTKNSKIFGSSTTTSTYVDDAGNSCVPGAADCRWLLDIKFQPINQTNEVPFDVTNPSGTVASYIHFDVTLSNAPGENSSGVFIKPKVISLDIPRASFVQFAQAKIETFCPGNQRFNGYDATTGNALCVPIAFQCGPCEAFTGFDSNGSYICQCTVQKATATAPTKTCNNAAGKPMVANYGAATFASDGSILQLPCDVFDTAATPQAQMDQCQRLQWGQGGSCFMQDLQAIFSNPLDLNAWADAVSNLATNSVTVVLQVLGLK